MLTTHDLNGIAAHLPTVVCLNRSVIGAGRGIGTYSIRLLGERYLGGRVSFDSTPEAGTTFRIHLPLRHK